MPSPVTETPAATPALALEHFARKLGFETDCWDVWASFDAGAADFVLLDVRSPELFEKSHVPGAINLPYGKIIERKLAEWPQDALFVVYCAGPHCNGADKAAFRLARLNRKVKLMIGGITGWADEGFACASGAEQPAAALNKNINV